MNAKEAREKSSQIILDKDQSQLDIIFSLIMAAVKKGEYDIHVDGSIRSGVAKQLKDLDYSIGAETNAGPNEVHTKISW